MADRNRRKQANLSDRHFELEPADRTHTDRPARLVRPDSPRSSYPVSRRQGDRANFSHAARLVGGEDVLTPTQASDSEWLYWFGRTRGHQFSIGVGCMPSDSG